MNIRLEQEHLGHGSYGDVFCCVDENGSKLAAKCCAANASGIPNILEASIMATIYHPNLNRALRIQATPEMLYIIQERAVTDLARHTRKDRGGQRPTIDLLRKWCFSLSQAVACLHRQGIIHADIKASNALLYADGTVRLTDYTLSVKKWKSGERFSHVVCTCTHRPPECLMNQPWDFSLDIWSLGVTFFELAYGELIFPYQGVLEPTGEKRNKDRGAKMRLRQRTLDCILNWGERCSNATDCRQESNIEQTDYLPYHLPEDFHHPGYSTFNSLLLSMLQLDPSKRPTIQHVLSHPFFGDLERSNFMVVRPSDVLLSTKELAVAERYINRYTDDEMVKRLALELYVRSSSVREASDHIKTAACVWIASKLVQGVPRNIHAPLHQILSTERIICHHLSFRLHTSLDHSYE